MKDAYFNVSAKDVGIFLGLTAAVVILVTVVYGAVYGFGRWSKDMGQAQSLMLSALNRPIEPDNLEGMPGQAPYSPRYSQRTRGHIQGGQFVCPNCGTTCLPNWDTLGSPLCPHCSSVMNVNRLLGAGLAAWGGQTGGG